MAMEITNNYSNYAAQSMAESSAAGISAINVTKKKCTEKTHETEVTYTHLLAQQTNPRIE